MNNIRLLQTQIKQMLMNTRFFEIIYTKCCQYCAFLISYSCSFISNRKSIFEGKLLLKMVITSFLSSHCCQFFIICHDLLTSYTKIKKKNLKSCINLIFVSYMFEMCAGYVSSAFRHIFKNVT